jgi:hypothetical protein
MSLSRCLLRQTLLADHSIESNKTTLLSINPDFPPTLPSSLFQSTEIYYCIICEHKKLLIEEDQFISA